ncbi:MAG: tetratricopeptide repeat protein [Candidatus Methanoperedens sp.]|nr:tetratricopeptide repeat protein [Candidatus Methanoperedens sp.]
MEKRFNKWKFYIFIIFFILFINPASSKTAVAWFNEGNVFAESEDYNKAIEAYNKAIAINPNYKYAWINKGNAFDKLGLHSKAIEAYNKAIVIDPNDKDAWYNKGIALMYLGEDDKAIEAFDKVIALDPDYAGAKHNNIILKMKPWLFLGGIIFFIVIGIIAVRNIRYNRNNNSENVTPDHNINQWKIFGYVVITGIIFSFLVEISRIIFSEYSFEMDKLVWAWIPLFFGVSMAYRLKKNVEFVYAFIIFFMVIFNEFNGVRILLSLGYFGWSYSKLEKQKHGSSSNVKHEAWKNKGSVLDDLGKYEEALECYDKALEINPKDDDIWFNKACSESKLNNKIKSIEYLQRAIELNMENKKNAIKDKDFDNIRNDTEFIELVSGS